MAVVFYVSRFYFLDFFVEVYPSVFVFFYIFHRVTFAVTSVCLIRRLGHSVLWSDLFTPCIFRASVSPIIFSFTSCSSPFLMIM